MVVVQRAKTSRIERSDPPKQDDIRELKHRRSALINPALAVSGLVAVVGLLSMISKFSKGLYHFANVTITPAVEPVNEDGGKIVSGSYYGDCLKHPRVVELENCTVSFKSPANMTFRPIWMPSFPGSGAASASKKGDLLKPIINRLTGWSAGSKNFHMSIRNTLKRCHAVNTPTAVCTNGHPLTDINPEKQYKDFNEKAIMVIRNFITAHPAMMQDKAFAYHGAAEQVPNQEWKEFRDKWTKSSFETWKSFILEWKRMKGYYHIDMYVAYEKLMDPDMGIAVVSQLSQELRQAGLQVAPDEEIPCIWYQSVAPEYRRLEHFFKYEPGYTSELKQFLVFEMEKLLDGFSGTDEPLVSILNGYFDDIRHNIRIDP